MSAFSGKPKVSKKEAISKDQQRDINWAELCFADENEKAAFLEFYKNVCLPKIAEYRINPERDFINTGRNADVTRDAEKLRKKKEVFTQTESLHKMISDVFEYMFFELSEKNNWLGQNFHSMLCAEFDDVFNGLDIGIELVTPEDSNNILFGIDVTMSEYKLRHKFSRIRKYGAFTQMRYYSAEYGRGDTRMDLPVAKTLIYLPASFVIDLYRIYIESDQSAKKEKLAKMTICIRYIILHQIFRQIDYYFSYIRTREKVSSDSGFTNFGKGVKRHLKRELSMTKKDILSVDPELMEKAGEVVSVFNSAMLSSRRG
jgi:hypothetical protein